MEAGQVLMEGDGVESNVIVLTAAVRPNPAYRSVLSGSDERLGQYVSALSDWQKIAGEASFDLVVVETSGSAELLAPYVTAHGYTPSAECAARGKGAVEAAALDDLLGRLDPAESSTIIKATGRLKLRNPVDLVVPMASGAVVRRTVDRSYCDTRFFATTYGFWQQELSGMDTQVDDDGGIFLEHVMAHRLIDAEFRGERVRRFPVRPHLVGSSGTVGTRYGTRFERATAPVKSQLESMVARTLSRKQI